MVTEAGQVSAMSLRTVFVVNPVSGPSSKRVERTERIEDFIRLHKLGATIEVSRRGGHATTLAREAAENGAELVVSVGGDGTMNEVARGLVGTGAIYGMIPCGSGNGLARDLGIPLDFRDALELLLEGSIRMIDSGEVNGLPFFNAMGLGLDAEIGRRFNLTKHRGFFNYLRIGLGTYFEYVKSPIEVVLPHGGNEKMDAFLATVANSTQYGNNARIAPRSSLDDGLLDLVVITSSNPFSSLGIAARLFLGNADRARAVRTIQSESFTIRRGASGPVHTDGEVHQCEADLNIRVRPKSLRVLVPTP